jgi:predicted nuclease of restriction endonuclease-like (RecB) superfamily
MSSKLSAPYKEWLTEIKSKIRSSQIKAALAVNAALIDFYWDLGKMIAEKLNQEAWGNKVIDQLSEDLRLEFPDMKGFSRTNLYYVKQFYLSYYENIQIVQQLVGQLPWGHNVLIFNQVKNFDAQLFYIRKSIENNWSRDILALQIKSGLDQRQGKAISNFKQTLPEPFSALAEQTLKDPYVFDFLSLTDDFKEKDIESQLLQNVSKFLLELGKGFAFVGRQHHLEIASQDYYIDLLFYHIPLKCYVVVELKNIKFIPEFAGKLNFYISAVDDLVKGIDDKPTIGMLLCRDKNNIEVEYALRGLNRPLGVSEFNITTLLPEEYKSKLPSIEEIENELLKQ